MVLSYKPSEPGEGEQGNPMKLSREDQGLLGKVRADWEDLAPLSWALMAHMRVL